MGDDRRHFPELMGDLDALPARDILAPLAEIASGVVSFGQRQEWRNWFHYLLAQRVPDGREWVGETLTELLVTGFMAHYPTAPRTPCIRGSSRISLRRSDAA